MFYLKFKMSSQEAAFVELKRTLKVIFSSMYGLHRNSFVRDLCARVTETATSHDQKCFHRAGKASLKYGLKVIFMLNICEISLLLPKH